MLDLSALEDKSPSTAEPSGKPLDIPLTDIEEDPNQPRTEFSAEAMEEMTASIKARGVRVFVGGCGPSKTFSARAKRWVGPGMDGISLPQVDSTSCQTWRYECQ